MICRIQACAVLLAGIATVTLASAQQSLTRQDAESLQKKLSAIAARGVAPAGRPAAPLRTSVTEREVNSYLKFSAREQLPAGLVDPQVTLAGQRRVSGRAIVDLDLVRTSKPRSWLDPAAYLTGSLEVKWSGLFDTAAGKGTLHIESATVGGLPIPTSLLQELVSFYSKSPELPGGFDLDKPFVLPASIREVQIQRGAATIIQ